MVNRNNIISLVAGFILCALLLQFCEGKDNPDKIKTVIKTIKITDTLTVKGGVTTKYKNVFIRKTDKSIVYFDKADTTSIEAKVYTQPISGNRSSGVATITTTGELLDFCATIECQDSIIETEITKYRDNSRMFLSPSYNTNGQINIGLDWSIKNKFLLKGGAGYDLNTKTPYISLGVGIPIF
jgi:hypothetical protein